MATLERSWNISINNPMTNGSQQDLFQQAFFELKQAFLTGSWTIVSSSTGASAGAGDLIGVSGSVGVGTAGNGAWISLTSPSAFLETGSVHVLLAVDDNTSPYQGIDLRVASHPYLSGTTTSLPTTVGTEDTVFSSPQIMPFLTATVSHFYKAVSTRGDVVYGIKATGEQTFREWFMCISNDSSSGGGSGRNRFGIFQSLGASLGNDAAEQVRLSNNTSYWIGLDPSGDNPESPEFAVSFAWDAGWTNGLDYASRPLKMPLVFYHPGSTRGRYMGTFPDFSASAANTNLGARDDADNGDTYRLISIGDIWIPVLSSSGDFQ